MFQVRERGTRLRFSLLQVALQLLNAHLRIGGVTEFQLLDFAIEKGHLVGGIFNGADELLPASEIKGNITQRARELYLRAAYLSKPLFPQLLISGRNRAVLVSRLLKFLENSEISVEEFGDFVAPLQIGGAALFDVGRTKVDVAVHVLGAFPDKLTEIAYDSLDQR